MLTVFFFQSKASAQYATGGSGLYRNNIYWLSWGSDGTAVSSGTSRNFTISSGASTLNVTCTVNNYGSGTAIWAYRPGNWSGDGLDDLYNIGGTGTSNTLIAGLKGRDGLGSGVTDSFRFNCSATLNGSAYTLPGIVVADAEQSNNNGSVTEYVQGTPILTGSWRIIDRFRTSACTSTTTGLLTGSTLRMSGPSSVCSSGPMAVSFLDGGSGADVQILNGGASAVALGVILNSDYGDAPSGYGSAVHAVTPTWTGGTLAPSTPTSISNTTFTLAAPAQPTLRLGATVDYESANQPNSTATGDDSTTPPGTDDEDGVTVPATVSQGQTLSIPAVVNGSGFLNAWFDWNRDGDFADSGEQVANDQAVSAGTTNLNVNVPAGASAGTSYARFRLCANSGQCNVSANVVATGEVEDYSFTIATAPSFTITKSSNGPWTLNQSGAQYTLTVTNAGGASSSGTITVIDVLPTGITPNWTGTRTVANFSCTFVGQTVTCTRSTTLASAGTAAITLPVNVTSTTAVGTNSITNYASVGGGGDLFGSAPTPGTGCTNVAHCTSNQTTVYAPDLTITKSHSRFFTVGFAETYSFSVGNSGTAATSGTITVTDTLPSGLTVNGGLAGGITEGGTNAANWTCNSNAATPQVITCTSSTAIAAGGTSVFTFDVNVGSTTAVGTNSITNTASVSGGGEVNTTNNSSSDPTTVIGFTPLSPIDTNPAGCAIPVADRVSSADFPASGSYTQGGSYPFTSTVIGYSNSVTYTKVSGTFSPSSPAFPQTYSNSGSAYSSVAGPLRFTSHEYTDFNFVGASGVDGIVRYDFATPLTSSDGILIWDIDNGENVEIRFYDSSSNLLSTASWTGQLISGSGGTVPNVGTNVIYFDGRARGNDPDPIYLLIPPTGQSVARIEVTQIDPSTVGSYDFAFVHGDCQKDYGDAPATYNAGNPARHSVPATPTVYLGSVAPDYEASPRTPLDGTGDDVSGSDDENGVSTFPVLTATAGVTYNVTVNVTTSSTSYLRGFIDFNRDGDFGDAGESSATITVSASGNQTLSFTTPAGMTMGVTYARFRLSSTSGEVTLPTGAATNGEVEDYQLSIVDSPDLTIDKSHSGDFTKGASGTYSITVGNIGAAATSGTITVSDTLPTGLSIADGTVTLGGTNAADWTCTAASNVITCTSTTAIATGGSSVFTFSVNVSPTAPSSLTNTATVSGGNEASANSGNNSDDDPTTILPSGGISGRVFEDVNYGGGSGRSLVTSSGVVRGGARVELYDSTGTFVTSTTTNISGVYTFSNLNAGSYTVRVVNSTVTSSRPGSAPTLIGVQTFRTNGTTGTAVADTERVGGENPNLVDAGNGSTTLASLTTSSTTAQSIAPVTVSNDVVANTDFGFNFDTIVNTNDAGQGSLRQFILNSNALTNLDLAQDGQPAGQEVSIFMISDGTSRPGLRAGLPNLLTGGVAVIQLTTVLPEIIDADTTIDGTTQTSNIGNTNSGSAGFSGAVGVGADGVAGTGDETSLSQIDKPEVEIRAGNVAHVIGSRARNTAVRGTALRAINGVGATTSLAGVRLNTGADNALIEQNFLGTSADSFADPGSGNRLREMVVGATTNGLTYRSNVGGFVQGFGVITSATNLVIERNTFNFAGYSFLATSSHSEQVRYFGAGPAVIQHNYLGETGIGNIDLGAASNVTVFSNTVENGMQYNTGSSYENAAIHARFGANNITITGNIVRDTRQNGHGIMIQGNGYGAAARGIKISKNSIFRSGKLGININPAGFSPLSTADGVSPNDGAVNAGDGNNGIDYPVVTSAILVGSNLTLTGFVGSSAGQSTFGNTTIEVFKVNDDGNNNGEIIAGDGLNRPHGEGQTYFLTITADANGNFNVTVPVSGITTGDIITATATDGFNNTSEFSANYPIVGGVPNVTLLKSCPIPADCTTAPQVPGTDLTFQIAFSNIGNLGAQNLSIVDGIPANTDYKVGSAAAAVGTTGLTFVIEYSDDYDPASPASATWTYTPVSGGGGASSGYDRLVRAIRWRVTSGILSNISPNNVGNVSFVTKIR